MVASATLGAPGVYVTPEPLVHTLTGVRMDVAAFAGVAPRGPARVPVVDMSWPDTGTIVEPDRPRSRSVAVPVESFDDYRQLYGGFEGPGRLPYAVAAFFEQGGRRAHIIRIVHEYGDADLNAGGVACTRFAGVSTTSGAARLWARSEGSWGNGLTAVLSYAARPLAADLSGPGVLLLQPQEQLDPGALVRLTLRGGSRVLRWVTGLTATPRPTRSGSDVEALLDTPVTGDVLAYELVEALLDVDDGDGRAEHLDGLGLHSLHPRWLAAELCRRSNLLWPDPAWIDDLLIPVDADLKPVSSGPFRDPVRLDASGAPAPVIDRYRDLVPEDFFDAGWVPGDEPDVLITAGLQAVLPIDEVALLVAPDLYHPAAFEAIEPIVDPPPLAGAEFALCLEPGASPAQVVPSGELDGLILDPTVASDLDRIVALQSEVIALAEYQRQFIVLLDVPPGLQLAGILRWRAAVDSMWTGCYHPWLIAAARSSSASGVVRVVPSAVAAGIAARTEWRDGVAHGAFNEIAATVVDVETPVDAARHASLHLAGINVFLRERDGVWLTGARTLSRDPAWRQLSTRRVVSMLERALAQQMQWVVFEPNNAALGAAVTHLVENFLEGLFRANTFAGATSQEAYFVTWEDTPQNADAGLFVVRIGVAPAEPLEYIVLRLASTGSGTLTVEEPGG
jgi:uncharacterized protein